MILSKFRLCIFDLDGTVLHSIPSIAHYANETLNRYGYPSLSEACYVRFVGNGARMLVRRMVLEVGGKEEEIEPILADYNAAYDRDPFYLSRPFDGIMEMLKALKAEGIKVAILSNKPDPTVRKLTQAIFGPDMVDLCLGAMADDDLKPNPKMAGYLMGYFGAGPEETLFIGDSPTDILTARNASVASVGVTWGYSQRDKLLAADPTYLAETPDEILSVVTGVLL